MQQQSETAKRVKIKRRSYLKVSIFYKYQYKEIIGKDTWLFGGNTDLVANTSTITIDLSTGVVTGAATTFSDAGVEAGNVISIGVGATMGEAVISSVTSNTVAAVATTQYITSGGLTNIPTGTTYTISEKPVYTLEDSNYAATEIYGVDTTEQSVANDASGDARKYAPQHAGWGWYSDHTWICTET